MRWVLFEIKCNGMNNEKKKEEKHKIIHLPKKKEIGVGLYSAFFSYYSTMSCDMPLSIKCSFPEIWRKC